jgi:hypothetical protein
VSRADAVRYVRLWALFAVLQFPVTVGFAVLMALGANHLVGYWWVAVPLAAEVIPGAVFWRVLRLGRALSSAQSRPGGSSGNGQPSGKLPA